MHWRGSLLASLCVWGGWFLIGVLAVLHSPIGAQDQARALHTVENAPFWFLLRTNGLVWFVLISGLVTAGVSTFVCLGFNGFFFGLNLAYSSRLFGWAWTLRGVAVHGITEVTSMVLAGSIGLIGVTCVWCIVQGLPIDWRLLRQHALRLGLPSIVLLLVSAIAEAWITPSILG